MAAAKHSILVDLANIEESEFKDMDLCQWHDVRFMTATIQFVTNKGSIVLAELVAAEPRYRSFTPPIDITDTLTCLMPDEAEDLLEQASREGGCSETGQAADGKTYVATIYFDEAPVYTRGSYEDVDFYIFLPLEKSKLFLHLPTNYISQKQLDDLYEIDHEDWPVEIKMQNQREFF